LRVLVTGASGFIGSRLVEKLLDLGHQVLAISRSPVPKRFSFNKDVQWIMKDIVREKIDEIDINDIDTVYHLAGATLGAEEDEYGYLLSNEATTVRLLRLCAGRVAKIIIASSQVVYGDIDSTKVTENCATENIGSAYACSKINTENWAQFYQKHYGGQYIVLRFCGFVEGGGVIKYMAERAFNDEAIELYSNGEVIRDYISIEKGIEALINANDGASNNEFEIYNIGSGQSLTALDLATLVCEQTDSKSKITLLSKPAPQRNIVLNIDKAAKFLHFIPGDLREMVRNYVHMINNDLEGSAADEN